MDIRSAGDDPADRRENITPVTPQEFVSGVSGTQVTVSAADLEIVFGYARHYDVDDDPAMIRVRKALDDAAPSANPSPSP